MKQFGIFTGIFFFAFTSTTFALQLQSLDQQEVTQEIEEKTLQTIPLTTLDDRLVHNNVLTVFFDKRGYLTGQFTNKPKAAPQKDTGRWIVKSYGVLCATWDHWNKNQPVCLYVYKLNNSLLFVNKKNENFESLVLKENIKSGNQVN